MLEDAISALDAAGVAGARQSAELLLMHALGRDRAFLYAHDDYELSSGEQARFEQLLSQRAQGVPAQYLTGTQEFYGRNFCVRAGVLIPRPETELLVENALRLLHGVSRPFVIDVGTGSGCIAVTLALERPDARVVAFDISADALAVAREIATTLGARIEFVRGDLLTPLLGESERVDLVVSNPPYVSEPEFSGLQREVRDFEPRVALLSGASGLEVYARLLPQAARVLRPGGWLAVEIGYRAATAMRDLFADPHWQNVRIETDLAGLDRVALAQRTESKAERSDSKAQRTASNVQRSG